MPPAPSDIKPFYRLPLLILGFISLGLGVGAGLARLGWQFPLPAPELALVHGPLMVSGFFGTVISLERAVALGRRWAYAGPLLAGLGGAALIAGAPMPAGPALLALGSLVLLAGSAAVYRRQRAVFTATLVLGAASWSVGNLLWLAGWPVQVAVPWWAGFLVLTIAGERLELSRLMPPSRRANALFLVGVIIFLTGVAATGPWPAAGGVILSAALMVLVVWLVRHDIARRTVRGAGLTRFIAVCLLSGYAWLGVGGIIGLFADNLLAGTLARDAFLHALFLGFVFSMVFGHAPLIFPAVTRFAVPYHPMFYLHLAALHLSLAVRVIGDLTGLGELRALGGAANGIAILLFVLNTVSAAVRGKLAARA